LYFSSEGKTTVSIAIADGLRKIGKKSILTLREPSLGPVFGIKGGATGGGKVQFLEQFYFRLKVLFQLFLIVYHLNLSIFSILL